MKNTTLYIILVLCCCGMLQAQNPVPASSKTQRILLWGATAHLGNGDVLENSAIGMENGKITFVMSAKGYKPAMASFDTLIELTGKHIYPGFIAMNTQIGMNEIELVRSTIDSREAGSVNPSARAIIAYNTDSKVTPTVRSNGILMAQIAPVGGLVSGTSSVVELDAWNWEDAAYKMDEGVWMNWPSMRIYKAWWADPEEEQQVRNEKQMQDLNLLFNEARAYSLQPKPLVENQHLEAMRGLFTGTKKLYVKCDFVREIIAAVQFCKEYGIQMVLCGGADSWRQTDLLKENHIPVIIMRTHTLPSREDDDVDLPYKLPALLKKAGVEVAITDEGFWQERNLPFEAGTSAGYGITKEEALTMITLGPARILGIDKTVGSLEDGKDATLFVSDGDALDMKTNHVTMAFIRGKQINLDNIQTQLYHKYMKKYGFE
ncbi:amidohydrolase [soil metagenome]